jgi:predicted NAD/FAD-binding protein
MSRPQTSRPRTAVIGSGVAGLTAAYLLQRTDDVTLYEAAPRLGGHAHTHDVATADDRVVPIDTGFIVHNERTYPYLLRLFRELGVETQASDMSLSVRCDGCGLEYSGARGLPGLFAQPRNTANPAFLSMLAQVPRFHRHARRVLAASGSGELTLGDFLLEGRYSPYFVRHFLLPLVSMVWSCPPHTSLQYPARYLFRFLDHHGLLSVTGSPEWRTVVGGSRSYVERVAKEITVTTLDTPVRTVRRLVQGVEVHDADDHVEHFGRVVIATHADEALALLAEPTDAERSALGAFEYSVNETTLHTDSSLLPRRARARASWNYFLDRCDGDPGKVQVSYHMNRLQGLEEPLDYVVSLNGGDRIASDTVIARMSYTHPIYTEVSVAAQEQLPGLNDDRIAFAGAYHGWGFHEDGCASGVRAAAALGVDW